MGKLLPRALPRNLHTKVFGLTFIDQKGPSVVSMRSVMCLLKFLPFSLHGAVWLLAVAQRFCSGQGFFFLTIARRVEGHRAKRGAPAWRCWLLIDTAPQPTQGLARADGLMQMAEVTQLLRACLPREANPKLGCDWADWHATTLPFFRDWRCIRHIGLQ